MQKIVLSKKTGFKNNSPYLPVVIRDKRGLLFYDTNPILPVFKFNLPQGEYVLESGTIDPIEPINYPLISLPRPERRYPKPYNFKIIFRDNPNKCSIIWDKKIIVFDNSFKEAPLPVIDFIRGHEFGHQYYATEKYADLWSANWMLKKGYNPSQVGSSPVTTLSEGAFERKLLMVKKLTRNGKRSF